MCMDSRKHLRIPDNFAFILRTGGASLRHSEFRAAYAIGVGGVRAIALLAHTDCGMSGIIKRKDLFVRGLVDNAGWDRHAAEEYFEKTAPDFEIGDPAAFVVAEAKRLRVRHPRVTVAPLIYRIEDNRLYSVPE